jgi:hypothetical protein
MTAQRSLKRLVRERQARTGERYTTARDYVLAQRHPPDTPLAPPARPVAARIPVVELVDLTAEAARLGLRCAVRAFPEVLARVDGVAALTRLRDALLATEADPATRLFRRVVLRGEQPDAPPRPMQEMLADGRRFVARVRAGIGGANDGGDLLALHVHDPRCPEPIVCLLWPLPPMPTLAMRQPSVILSTLDNAFVKEVRDLASLRLQWS